MEVLEAKHNESQIITPPSIQGLMSGTTHTELKNGVLTLFYSDGATESAECTNEQFKQFENYFNIISYVQSKRKK